MKSLREVQKDFMVAVNKMDSEECFEIVETLDDDYTSSVLIDRIEDLK